MGLSLLFISFFFQLAEAITFKNIIESIKEIFANSIFYVFVATFSGVFLGFLLEGYQKERAELDQFRLLVVGLSEEIKNNIQYVEKNNVIPISFEVVKFILGNHIFYKFIFKEINDDHFLSKLWKMLSSLRTLKENQDFISYAGKEDYQLLQEINTKSNLLFKNEFIEKTAML